MQTTSQPLSLTTICTPPLSACPMTPIMQLTLSSGRPTTASRSPSAKATASCLPPTHTSPGLTLLCPTTATLFPSAGPRSFLVSPLIPTSPSPPTSGEWPERARSRLGILKALAGVSWGQSKEVLLLTYQMLIKPILSYAAPVWFPNAPTTAVSTLQSHSKLSPSHSHWLPQDGFHRPSPSGGLSTPCSRPSVHALLPVPPQCPLTKPSLPPDRHRGLRPSQHQAHPAVPLPTFDLRPPHRWHHATRLLPRVPPAGALGCCCHRHCCCLPKQVAGSQPACGLCL